MVMQGNPTIFFTFMTIGDHLSAMDANPAGQQGKKIAVAMLTKPPFVFSRNWNKIFHRKFPSQHNIAIRQMEFTFEAIGLSKRKKMMNAMECDVLVHLLFSLALSGHQKTKKIYEI
jgi:hypothetical protein